MTGRTLIATLIGIVVLTAVLPPAAAWAVNQRRVARASAEALALQARLLERAPELRRAVADADVLSGPGQMPRAERPDTLGWVGTRRANLSTVLPDAALSADPWGNAYLVNLAAGMSSRPSALWVLSAGPNGIVETAFDTTTSPAGDDIGAVVPSVR